MTKHHVCPWWLGYLLASPIRRLLHDPREILSPHVREGMTVLEPGPGMGFFTLELLRLTGPSGRVVVVEIQPRMLAVLKRRAAKAGLLDRLHFQEVCSRDLCLFFQLDLEGLNLGAGNNPTLAPDHDHIFHQLALQSQSYCWLTEPSPLI